jgi:HSP20 family molecular chaperone IbpA
VKVEGNSIIITAKQEIQEASGTRTRVFEQKFSLPSGVKAELVKSSLTREGVLVITAPKGNVAAKQSYTETVENKNDKVLDPSSWEDERRKESAFDDRRRVPSFDDKRVDSAFDDMRKGSAFDSALSSTRQGSIFDSSRPSIFDDKSIFDRDRSSSLFDRDDRSLFAANSEQNGISRVQYDDDSYKIMVNVEKYKPEELVIKTVDNTVIVEAKHEEKTSEGRSYSTQSFNQSFTLPRGVNPESVTSALSKEGVLTISAPLPKALKSSNSERVVPIKNY